MPVEAEPEITFSEPSISSDAMTALMTGINAGIAVAQSKDESDIEVELNDYKVLLGDPASLSDEEKTTIATKVNGLLADLGLGDLASVTGVNVLEGLTTGLEDETALTAATTAAETDGQAVVDSINEGAGCHSPSTKTRETGVNLMVGLENGLKSESVRAKLQGYSVGNNIVKGMESGLNAGRSSLINTAVSIAIATYTAMKNALGIHSPSTLFRDMIGENITAGIGEGIVSGMPDTERIIGNAAGQLLNTTEGVVANNATTTNTSNYNTSSNLVVENMYMDSEIDVQMLAEEMAAMSRRTARGRGH